MSRMRVQNLKFTRISLNGGKQEVVVMTPICSFVHSSYLPVFMETQPFKERSLVLQLLPLLLVLCG